MFFAVEFENGDLETVAAVGDTPQDAWMPLRGLPGEVAYISGPFPTRGKALRVLARRDDLRQPVPQETD